ncbi:MAG: sigma-70 family RNA polymerase sigma factor [Planctomycetales bacterium]|nr:sigma-70 family RNA polymerase sigma factor [Planctomycetales bacterium]
MAPSANADHDESAAIASDASLLRRFRNGESDAATELYQRYADRLIVFAERRTGRELAARFDPEDVIQSVFRTFFRRAAEGGVDVPPGEELWQLLLVMALNKVRRLGKFHRRQRRNVQQTVTTEAAGEVVGPTCENSWHVLQLVVEETLSQFPDLQRQMIERRIQGNSIVEIAAETGRCRRTVERVLRQFREMMSDYLEQDNGGDLDSET